MSIHAVIRTDDMFGTDNRVGIYSAKFYEEDHENLVPAEIDNGNVVKLEGLLEGERELYQAVVPAKGDDMADIYIVASPELMYDERKRSLDDFYNEADRPIRTISTLIRSGALPRKPWPARPSPKSATASSSPTATPS